jgi:hypothetical protein
LQQRIKHIKSSLVNTKNYQHYQENGIKRVLQDPVSTFSIDVDTGSYTNIRRMTHQGMFPPADAIRIEEFVNYFDYDHSQQSENNSGTPFSVHTSIASSPWTEQRHIMAIRIKRLESRCYPITGRNWVLCTSELNPPDVSGLMDHQNKVAEYRLLGYENSTLKSEDFNHDKIDAGEIGAGHAVTALLHLTIVILTHCVISRIKTKHHRLNLPLGYIPYPTTSEWIMCAICLWLLKWRCPVMPLK